MIALISLNSDIFPNLLPIPFWTWRGKEPSDGSNVWMSDVLSKHSIFVSLLLVLRFMLFLQSLCFARVVPSTSVFCLCCSFNPCVLLALFLRSLCVACVFPSIPVVFFFCSCAVPSIPVFCLCCSLDPCVLLVLLLRSLCFASLNCSWNSFHLRAVSGTCRWPQLLSQSRRLEKRPVVLCWHCTYQEIHVQLGKVQ